MANGFAIKFGSRVQKSVFECLLNERQYQELKKALDKIIKPEEDSVRFYLLCQNCAANIQVTGLGTYIQNEELIIV